MLAPIVFFHMLLTCLSPTTAVSDLMIRAFLVNSHHVVFLLPSIHTRPLLRLLSHRARLLVQRESFLPACSFVFVCSSLKGRQHLQAKPAVVIATPSVKTTLASQLLKPIQSRSALSSPIMGLTRTAQP